MPRASPRPNRIKWNRSERFDHQARRWATPSPASPSSNGAFYALTGRNVNATIHALAANNKTEVLSRPTILTRSNQQATILVGEQIARHGFTPIAVGNQPPSRIPLCNGHRHQSQVTPFIRRKECRNDSDPEISSLSL